MQSSVTVRVPRKLYDRIRRAAEQRRRSVDELVVEAISAAAPVLGTPQGDLRSALAQMAYLNDAALWQAARATVPPPLRNISTPCSAIFTCPKATDWKCYAQFARPRPTCQ